MHKKVGRPSHSPPSEAASHKTPKTSQTHRTTPIPTTMPPASTKPITTAALAATVSISVAVAVFYLRRRKARFDRLQPKADSESDEEVGAEASPCCSTDLQEKPQYRFKRVLADNSYSPFTHFNPHGPTKDIPLKSHPYEEDITYLLEHPPSFPVFFGGRNAPDTGVSFVWVDTQHQLESLVEMLSKECVFAVDTEQHGFRSFLGFTALMQISTLNDNFLLDTIALHDSMNALRPLFANPSICKVFHGADNDILWLQRDFHIYVVNLFDTAKACLVLSKPRKSLAYLLETYCRVAANKMMQREDWRLRPLSEEMSQYACTDVHYLLYIAHRLALELKAHSLDEEEDKLHSVHETLRRSNTACLQLYNKNFQPFPGDSAASSIILRYSNGQVGESINEQTREIIRRLCTWRDLMARIHDESLQYVLSDKAIYTLGLKCPRDSKQVFDVIFHADLNKHLHSVSSPFPVAKGHIEDICCIFEGIGDDPDIIFRKFFQRYLVDVKLCPLSIYNFALLSELNVKLTNTLFPKQNVGKSEISMGKKASRELFVQKFSCKSPVYHNCRIYAMDGRLLCYCDQRKIEWYLCRDLAKIIENDPLAIMLLFEPKGRPEDEGNDFYIQSKKNICVGCGEGNHYLRYRIIPSCYRMHFPEHLKSHRSHDIVLLCVDCHEVAHTAAEKYKKKIAAEYKIPLFVRKVVDLGENKAITITSSMMEGYEEIGVSPLQLRTAAMALKRHGSKMPQERREELIQIVKSYFGGREIASEDIEAALLVGMSPLERRKLERKRGVQFASCDKDTICSTNTLSNKDTEVSYESSYPLNDTKNTCNFPISELYCSSESEIYVSNEVKQESNNKKLFVESNVSISVYDDVKSDNLKDKDLQGEIGASSCSSKGLSNRTTKKLSLLGHGPHGRQVVDFILNEHGEEGILQFCQRWRQVFVEAIRPRFLPSGWNIKHSGRREFGDYSVYKPS